MQFRISDVTAIDCVGGITAYIGGRDVKMDRIYLHGETEADDDTGCPPYKYGLVTPAPITGVGDEEHDGLSLMNDIEFLSTITIND